MPHSTTTPTRESRTPPRPSSQLTLLATNSTTNPPHTRRPSLSNTMHWLSRSSTQSSAPYTPSKPTRISEPKLVRSIELLSQQRSGVLGSGATIVRTPDEALRETNVRLTFDGKPKDKQIRPQSPEKVSLRGSTASIKHVCADSVSPEDTLTLASPPLPPLPLPGEEESEFLSEVSEAETEVSKAPSRPVRALPPTPLLRPSLKSSKPIQHTEDATIIPPLPPNITAFPEPPPFRPILLSELPTDAVDPSKIIVILETSTATQKTTLETLQSRPSLLSKYLSLLLPSQRASTASSVYSTESDDMSTFRNHLSSQGLLPRICSNIHIFLDRPSSSYTHILNYLRMPLGSPENPECLPRSVQMYPTSNLRLEALLELREEAAYLKLEGLHKLCLDEIRMRHGPRLHTRGLSTGTIASTHSMHASIGSLHALLEKVESDAGSNPRDSVSSDSKSSKGSATDTLVSRTPPTPQSWSGRRGRSEGRSSPIVRSPPAGWI